MLSRDHNILWLPESNGYPTEIFQKDAKIEAVDQIDSWCPVPHSFSLRFLGEPARSDWFIFVFVAFSLRADNRELDANSTVLNNQRKKYSVCRMRADAATNDHHRPERLRQINPA